MHGRTRKNSQTVAAIQVIKYVANIVYKGQQNCFFFNGSQQLLQKVVK